MNKPLLFALALTLALLAIAPLEFAQSAQPASSAGTAGEPNTGPAPPPPALVAASASGTRRGRATTTVTTPSVAQISTLNRALREVLSASSPDCKKILDPYPAFSLAGIMGGARAIRSSSTTTITLSQYDVLNNALRALLATESNASRQVLAAHPRYNIFTTTATVARVGTSAGRNRATTSAVDIPTAAELNDLNLSLENVLSKASPDAKKVYDAYPHYALMDPAGQRGAVGRGVPISIFSATGRSSAPTPGGNGLGEGN